MLKAIAKWLLGKPVVVLCIVIALGYGVIKIQGWRIAGLNEENDKLETTIKTERDHNGKVVGAFEDKGVKDADRNEFKREAEKALAEKQGGEVASPALRDAYNRVRQRLAARKAKSPV